MSRSAVISFENVSFSYDKAPVVENVNLEVPEKSFVYVVGPNGGGKTTLLKLILGLLRPTKGNVLIFGQPPAKVRRRIGYMAQHPWHDLKFPVSVMDVVLMGRLGPKLAGWYSKADREAALKALHDVDLDGFAGRPYSDLSGGQRQRVLIARALVNDPDLLLLDEPTANVDVGVQEKVHEILGRLSSRMTILMVSHDFGFVSSQVSNVICVNRKVVMHPTSAISGELIREIYGRQMNLVRHDQGSGVKCV